MTYQEGAETISTPYLVHHLMQKSSGNKDLVDWARTKKLFPWVAVGAPLKVSLTWSLWMSTMPMPIVVMDFILLSSH